MKIPTIQGIIDRRILINFTADPVIVRKIIPFPFAPKIYLGKSIIGICLIRLSNIRPKGFPDIIGISSENAAHRIAVEWKENGEIKEGVFIPRRDTSSIINNLAGGKVFPGKHHHSTFDVKEENGFYHVAFKNSDGTSISIDAEKTSSLNANSIFKNLENASAFFEAGSVGYSPNNNHFDGLKLKTHNWKISALKVSSAKSSFFENENIFPKGSIKFDNALLMTQINHEWISIEQKKCVSIICYNTNKILSIILTTLRFKPAYLFFA